MGDGVLLSETAFPKDGKELDGKKRKESAVRVVGWKTQQSRPKSREDPRHGVVTYKKLPI